MAVRLLAWLLLALALIAAGGDGLRLLETGRPDFAGLAELWARLDPASLDAVRGMARDGLPAAATASLGALARLPAWLVLGLAGAVLLVLFRRRPQKPRPKLGTRLN